MRDPFFVDNSKPFGGFNMLLFGDFFQLRPIRGRYLFKDKVFWPLFKPYFLRTNKRQENEHSFVELLNRLRIGKATSEDISTLSKRLLNLYPDVCTENMLHIYPTLREVGGSMKIFRKKLILIFILMKQHILYILLM